MSHTEDFRAHCWHPIASNWGGGWKADQQQGTWIRKGCCLRHSGSPYFVPPQQKSLLWLDNLSLTSRGSVADLTIRKMYANQRGTVLFISIAHSKDGHRGQLGSSVQSGSCPPLMTPTEPSEKHGLPLHGGHRTTPSLQGGQTTYNLQFCHSLHYPEPSAAGRRPKRKRTYSVTWPA